MEEKKEEIINKILDEALITRQRTKDRLEEMLTEQTNGDKELPEPFVEKKKEQLAETIKEIKVIENEKTDTED